MSTPYVRKSQNLALCIELTYQLIPFSLHLSLTFRTNKISNFQVYFHTIFAIIEFLTNPHLCEVRNPAQLLPTQIKAAHFIQSRNKLPTLGITTKDRSSVRKDTDIEESFGGKLCGKDLNSPD